MREEAALLAVTLGDAIDTAFAELEDARRAVHVFALRRREECRVELRGERVAFAPKLRLDGEPHGAVRGGHQGRAVDDAAGPLELGLMRQLERALVVLHVHHPEAPRAQELRRVEERLELLFHQASSIAIAVASPPPMQRLATPRGRPYLRSPPISVTRMRAPEAPIGWPSAQAPPCTFTLSCGRPCSFIAAIVTTANASLISKRSTFFAVQPVRSSSLPIAATGAVVNKPGSCACVDWPITTASGARPRRSAVERRIITSAAAPSEIELELAAVTVPSLRKAGLRAGIFSKLALKGCSSVSMNFSSLPCLMAIGVVSQANQPSLFAFCARSSEVMAKRSCASLEKSYFWAQSSAKVPMRRPLS